MIATLNNGRVVDATHIAYMAKTFYGILEEGKRTPTTTGRLLIGGALNRGEELIKQEKDLIDKLAELRQDIFMSDREVRSLALAVDCEINHRRISDIFHR